MFWENVGLFFLATVKFIISPPVGRVAGNSFWLTWGVVIAGGIFSATVFYLLADYFMDRAKEKAKSNPKPKKKFTRSNRLLIKVKNSMGIYGLSLLTAALITIPIGSVIAAKFYGDRKSTIFILYAGILVVGTIATSITYIF